MADKVQDRFNADTATAFSPLKNDLMDGLIDSNASLNPTFRSSCPRTSIFDRSRASTVCALQSMWSGF